jgi:hypothetical protein
MIQGTKIEVLNAIGRIYEESEDCKLEDAFFSKIDNELSFLSSYFRTSKIQSFFIAMIFVLNYKGDTVDLNDLIKYFDCNPVKILAYSDVFSNLHSSGILRKQKSRHRIDLAFANDQFRINEKVSAAILQNEPMPQTQSDTFTDIIELLEEIYNIGNLRDDDEISTFELFHQTRKLISVHLHIPLIRKVDALKLSIDDAYLYLYLIWKTASGKESTDIGRALEMIYDNSSKRVGYMQKILSNENVLIKMNLIETVDARFFNDTEMKLTTYSFNLLKECGMNLIMKKKDSENIILPAAIQHRELIFSESEMKQLFLLKDLMKGAKLKRTQKRLAAKSLPTGVTVLLHGAPGTGKTEVVKQLAKETNRELMKVEISKSKSMWYGESEKIMKRIFTDYKSFAKDCKRMPILLFNEADAIFSTRRSLGNSNVDRTENAMQNILLEEMENFEGILIATTNLSQNFDTAFERRFLFKINFRKPDTSIRARIWKSKLPALTPEDCNLLAGRFDFSGGQIDNILRKNEISEIIHGKKVTLESLLAFCNEESLGSSRGMIGFNKI